MLARFTMALAALAVAVFAAIELNASNTVEPLLQKIQQGKLGKLSPERSRGVIADLNGTNSVRPGTQALLLSAGLAVDQARFGAAERYTRRALTREPSNFSAWVTLGLVRLKQGDRGGALSALREAKRLNPLYPMPRLQ